MVAFVGIGMERSMGFVVSVCWVHIPRFHFCNLWPLLAMMPVPLSILSLLIYV